MSLDDPLRGHFEYIEYLHLPWLWNEDIRSALVIGLGGWYSITYRVMSEPNQRRFRWVEWGIYFLRGASILMLLQPGTFSGEVGNALHVAHMNNGPSYPIYSVYQFLVAFGILFNLLVGERVGLTSRGKYYLAASIFPVLSVLYGVSSLGSDDSRLPGLSRIRWRSSDFLS